jgi:hypothetical protein
MRVFGIDGYKQNVLPRMLDRLFETQGTGSNEGKSWVGDWIAFGVKHGFIALETPRKIPRTIAFGDLIEAKHKDAMEPGLFMVIKAWNSKEYNDVWVQVVSMDTKGQEVRNPGFCYASPRKVLDSHSQGVPGTVVAEILGSHGWNITVVGNIRNMDFTQGGLKSG